MFRSRLIHIDHVASATSRNPSTGKVKKCIKKKHINWKSESPLRLFGCIHFLPYISGSLGLSTIKLPSRWIPKGGCTAHCFSVTKIILKPVRKACCQHGRVDQLLGDDHPNPPTFDRNAGSSWMKINSYKWGWWQSPTMGKKNGVFTSTHMNVWCQVMCTDMYRMSPRITFLKIWKCGSAF